MPEIINIDNPFAPAPANKLDRLRAASLSKKEQLIDTSAEKNIAIGGEAATVRLGTDDGRSINVDDPRSANSWVAGLGLNPSTSEGALVNGAASLVSGAGRWAGHLLSAMPSNSAIADEASVSEAQTQAYNRMQRGIATPADLQLLNERVQRPSFAQAKAGTGAALGESALATLKDAANSRATARKINSAFDWTGIVDQSARDKLHQDIGSGFQEDWDKVTNGKGAGDVISGVAGLLMNAGSAAINNKQAAAEYILENIPQLLGGQVVMGASNVGYALDYYNKAIENHQAKNGGALPDEAARHEMAAYAASLALAEHVGDTSIMALGKAAKAVGVGAEKITKTGFKQALLNSFKATAGGVVGESLTEGYQTFAEAKLEGKEASAKDIYTGGVIGGIAGGGLSGGMRVAAEVAKATPEHAAERKQKGDKAGEFQKAVDAGDPSIYLDEKSENYDPQSAVRVLYATAQKPDATPEQKAQAQSTAAEVVANLETKQQELQEQYDDVSEAGLKKTEAQLGRFEAQLAKTDPANTERVTQLTEAIADAKEQIAGYANVIPANKKAAGKLEKELESISKQLTETARVRDEFLSAEAAKVADTDVQADIDLADKGDTAAAERVINLSMALSSKLDPKAAKRLAANMTNGLDDTQRDYLRAFSKARQTENQLSTMRKVSQEILTGTDKNLGIAQYRSNIGAAIKAKSQKTADRYLGLLDNFRTDHAEKAAMAKEAYEASVKDGKERQVLRTPNNAGWFVTTDLVGEKERITNGGLAIHPIRSKKLVPEMQVEAQALDNAHAELTAAVTLQFGKKAVQSNTSQAAPQAPTPATPSATTSPPATQTEDAPGKNNLPPRKVEEKTRLSPGDRETVAPQQQEEGEKENKSDRTYPDPTTGQTTLRNKLDTLVDEKDTEITKDPDYRPKNATPLVKALQAITSPGFNAEEVIASAKWAIANGRQDLAEIAAEVAEKRAQEAAEAKPGIPESNPNYGKAAAALAESAAEQQTVAETLRAIADGISVSPSPAVAASAPIAVADAPAQGYAASSTPAAQEGEVGVITTNTPTDTAAGQDAGQQAAVSEANPAPAAKATPSGLRILTTYKKLTGTINQMWNAKGFNPIAQFLKQEQNSERYTTARPLVATPSFLASWEADANLPLQFIEEGESLLEKTEKNLPLKRALNSLQKHLNAWVPIVDGLARKHGGTLAYQAEDLMQYLYQRDAQGDLILVDGAPILEENIQAAIAYGGYSWLTNQLHAPAWKTESDISKMHGRGKEGKVTSAGQRYLRDMVGFQDRVIHELGDLAAQSLGFQNEIDAPTDLLPRLKMALGTHALIMLQEAEMIERSQELQSVVEGHFIEDGDIEQDAEAETESPVPEAVNGEAYYSYIRLARDPETGKLTGAQQRIRDADVGSRDIVNRLFGVDKAARIAGTKPAKFTQKYAKHTQQEVSDMQAEVIQESMDDPFRPIDDMLYTFMGLGREGILSVAGKVDLESGAVHEANRASYEAQNMNLENQFDQGMEGLELDPHDLMANFTPDVLTTPRYIEQSIWKNFRAGFLNSSLNPQTSKIHRFLFAREGWKATIELGSDMETEFKIAVAMGLGVKTDKQRNAKTLDATFEKGFQAELAKEGVSEAIDILRRAVILKDDTVWNDETRALVAKVAKGREGMQSLQAMVMYAKFLEAEATGAKSVDVTLLVGVDGKTNGPMLSHLALGAAGTIQDFFVLLNRGGFYSTEAGQAEHFSEYYEGEEAQDLYEDLGTKVIDDVRTKLVTKEERQEAVKEKGWKRFYQTFTLDELRALEMITDQLIDKAGKAAKAMRNWIKVPLTSFAFGSSLKKSLENMQNGFVQGFYDQLEGMASNKVGDKEVRIFVQNVNALIKMGNRKESKDGKIKAIEGAPIPVGMPIEGLLKYELSFDQQAALKAAFDRIIGQSVKSTMETYFDTFIERRKQLNNTIQAGYQVYEAAYASAKMAAMERLMDAGEVAFRISKRKSGDVRVPLHDLTAAQDKELRDSISSLLPVMHNHYSIGQNSLKSGLYMAKTRTNVSASPLYANKVYVNKDIGRMVTKDGKRQLVKAPHLSSQAQTRVEESPGVAGAAYSIHSSDSSIMHQMLRHVKGSLNVHDEGGNGVHKVRELARELNKATAETFLEYSPAREAAFMLERAITNMAKAVRAGTVAPEAVNTLIMNWSAGFPAEFELTPQEAAHATLETAMANAYAADSMRLKGLSILKSVDQYVWEGGQFVADQAFRDRAAAKLKQVEAQGAKPSAATLADLEFLIKTFEKNPTARMKVAAWVDVKAQEAKEEDAPAPTTIKLVAELGKTKNKHEADLVKLLEQHPDTTAKALMPKLRSLVSDDFQQKLIGQMERTLGDVKIRYVTVETDASTIPVPPSSPNARGWYDPNNRIVYVLAPEYKHSGVQMQLVLHELMHAALLDIVYNERAKRDADPVYKSDALDLIDELEELRLEVDKYLDENSRRNLAPIVQNVDELIAYGMTNPATIDVMKKVKFKSKIKGNGLVNAMKEFIDIVTGLVFGRKNDTMAAGMYTLVQNVSGLFEAVAQEQEQNSAPWDLRPSADMAATSTFTTEEIYDGLAQSNNGISVSTGFDFHLRRLLNGIVSEIHGPFGVFKDLIATTQATDAMDIWLEAKQTGVAPFGSQVLGLNLHFTEQEAFVLEQVEATVRSVLSGNEGQTTAAYRELRKLFEEAGAKLTPQDFTNAGLDATLHGFIFNVQSGTGNRSDYLSRFAALGLANEKVASLLGFSTAVRAANATPTFVERLYAAFESIMAFIAGKLTNTYAGQPADEKLENLINTLVKIEVKKAHKLTQRKLDLVQHAEDRIKQVADAGRRQVEKFGNSKLFQNSRFSTVQAVGTSISLVAGDRVEQLMENMNTLRDQRFHRRQGVIAGALNEVRGTVSTNLESQRLLREAKNNERHRKEEDDLTARFVLESFDKLGKELTPEQKHAITAVFLRTGMHVLTDPAHGFSLQDVLKLISVPAALDREIAAYEQQLAKSPFAQFYINAADGLGLYMAGGPVKTKRLLKNAHSIARMHSTQYRGRVTESQAQNVEPVIDALASLYAIRHSNDALLKDAAAVLKTELARPQGNGVEMVFKLHARLESDSRDRLFRGSEALMMKGYMPEIYDPYMDIQVVSAAEGAELEAQGYTPGLEVAIDPTDTEKRYLHSRRDGGLQRFQTGVFAYDGMRAKGTKTHNGDTTLTNTTGMQNASTMANINKAKAADVQDMMARRIDMRTERKNQAHTYKAPILNPAGDVVNWAYLMEADTKDSLLHRDNRMEQVLGRLAGGIIGKESAVKHNRDAVEALKAQYDAEYATKTASYITISPVSNDPELRQIWNMLPEHTKQAIRDVWGREAMTVRIDTLDLNFGYRKLTLSSAFDKDPDARNIGERLFVQFWEAFLGRKAALWVRRGEDVWETIVREAKDIIVVKSGITLLGNQLSNMSLLLAYGVGPREMLHHHRIALQGAMAYRKDSGELFRLQRALDTGYTQGRPVAELQSEINKLKDALERNPVRQLIEAGLMPTIVEDISTDEDMHSYKSQFTKAVQDRLERVNPKVLGAAKFLYMTHDTRAYRALSYGTQLSDFVARYTLYQHLTTGKNAVAPADAIQRASDAFINYDIPSHRVIQKLNDLGLLLFTKYFMRVQKVIAHLYRENPGRALSLLAFNNYFDWVPTIMDSGLFSRDVVPTGMGALMYPTLMDDTIVMKALASPFK